jgi:hypothetical protein
MAAIRKTSESTYIFLDIKDNTLDDIANSCHWNENSGFHLPRYGLGALDKLPLEIIHLALIQLDMRSLADFRHVKKSARLVTDSIPQYKRILVHAPASIRGCLNIETARFFSCQDLYEKLSTAECDSCGDFGGYLYLVTCRRVCLLCFSEEADYLPLSRNDAIRKFGLGSKDLACLPRMKSLPGRYSPRGIKRRQRETLFDFSAAREAGIAVHGSLSSMENYASKMASKRLQAYNSRLALRGTDRENLLPPRSEDAFDGHCSNPRRFMGIIRAPFFGIGTVSPDWGFHCLACKAHHYGRPLHWRRKYTMDSFQDHVSECGEIIEGKHVPRIT